MSIKFSIIVPIYNVQAYLEECIESIIHQTYANLEIILVDDGSPDECPTICDQYAAADSRIKVIHKENGGLIRARIAGTEVAAGEYICCVDGDDYIAADYVEKMADAAQVLPDIICCGYYEVTGEKTYPRPIDYRTGYYDRKTIEVEIFPALIQSKEGKYFPLNICMKAIRRELYRSAQGKVDPAITIGEDQACMIPCVYQSHKIVVLDECLYYYRQHNDSVTKKKSYPWNGYLLWMEHLQREINLNEYDFYQQFYRRVVHEFYVVSLSQFGRNEPYSVIRQEIIEYSHTPIVAEAIQKAQFSGSIKMNLIDFVLKNRWIFPLYLFSRINYDR